MATNSRVPVLPVPRTPAAMVLSNPHSTLEELAAVVERDRALTVQVIRAGNYAVSASPERASTVHQSMMRLGVNGARRFMSMAVMEEQFHELDGGPLNADELWRYAVATGLIAEALTESRQSGVVAFTAGLIHDLGRLALVSASPSRYAAVIAAVRSGVEPLQAERDQFGAAHTDAGWAISREWGLPKALGVVLNLHHEDEMDGLSGVVAVARLAALHAGYDEGLPVALSEPPSERVLGAINSIGGPAALAEKVRQHRRAFVRNE